MSRVLADRVTNYNNDGAFEAEKGINIPLNYSIEIGGQPPVSGGRYLESTATGGLQWSLFPDLFDGDYNSLTNRPTIFSGNYNDLSNKPVVLDLDLGVVQTGEILSYNGSDWVNVPQVTVKSYDFSVEDQDPSNAVDVVLTDNLGIPQEIEFKGGTGIDISVVGGGIVITNTYAEYLTNSAQVDAAAIFTGGTHTGISYTYDTNSNLITSTVNFPAETVYTLEGSSPGVDQVQVSLEADGATGPGNINFLGSGGVNLAYDAGTSTITFSKTDPAPYTLPAATTSALGGVIPDGTSITVDGFGNITAPYTYTLPTATTSTLGGVIPDGVTITVNGSGEISAPYTYILPVATTSVLGGVIVDGVSIEVDVNGEIGLAPASSSNLGGVITDETTITADGSGIISLSAGIGDLSDVDTGFTDGDVLTFNSGTWSPAPPTVDINNVSLISSSNPQDFDVLIYNSAASPNPAYENRQLILGDVSDVTYSGLSDGDILKRVSGEWQNAKINERKTVSESTNGIASLAEDDVDITTSNVYHLMAISVDNASRVRIYTNESDRTSDAARAEGVSVPANIGLIAEVVFAGAGTEYFVPALTAYNQSSIGTTAYLRVTNKTGVTTSIAVDLDVMTL
jgi:hypothetical protein